MDLHLSRVGVVAVAVAALVASATGGAVADRLITSDDIKNRTIERQDLADDSVGNRSLRDNAVHQANLSPTIRRLLTTGGTPGPAGPAGPAGAPGLSGYQVVVEEIEEVAGTVVVVECPAGKSVLGGGWVPGAGGGLQWQVPAADGSGWRGLVGAPGPGVVTLDMYAICATVR